MTRGTTTLDCSQRISSVVTNSKKSTSFQPKPWSPCTKRASRGRAVPSRPSSWPGVGVISKPVCGEVSTHEPGGNDPAYAREKDNRRRQCVENSPRQHLGRGAKIAGRRTDLLLDKIAVTEHPTRIARTTSARWTSFCMHLGLVPSRNKHVKCLRANSGVLIMEPPEKYVSEGDSV